jgi:tRNA A37 methylthiotransferase MiaB
MRRFGDADRFLSLLADVRAASPRAGARSNVIVGFPGETEEDVETLCDFLEAARLDAIGVFGYSDEDGTDAVHLDGHHDAEEIAARTSQVVRLAEELTAQRAEDRLGETVDVLIEAVSGTTAEGRPDCQGPDVDGLTSVVDLPPGAAVGDLVSARVTASSGVDLIASGAQRLG